jgi:hypothetical protein
MARERVHAANFVRAETDRYFDDLAARAGGINRFDHTRTPAPIEDQAIVRLNRDTLYSVAIADVSAGATVTLPEAGGRYQTAMVVDGDHYIDHVFDRPGRYRLEPGDVATRHAAIAVRTLVDPTDPADVAAVAALQDRVGLEAPAAEPLDHPDWDAESLDATRGLLLQLAAGVPDFSGAFGSRTATDPIEHLLGTAAGWGGLPAGQATYVPVAPGLPVGHYVLKVPADVPVRGFWSVSVYDADGFFAPNAAGRYTVNSITAVRDDDGGATIHLGGDPATDPNAIPLPEGWNYTVRLYQPGPEILDGRWTFPALTAA